jgi:hypothetical protein
MEFTDSPIKEGKEIIGRLSKGEWPMKGNET